MLLERDGNNGAHTAAYGNTRNGNPIRNDDAAAATAIARKVDDVGQENDDCGGDDGDNNKDDNKWGRGALFSLSSPLLSLAIGNLVSDAVAATGLLLLGIVVPRIDIQHCNSLRPRRRRTLCREKSDLMRKVAELDAMTMNVHHPA